MFGLGPNYSLSSIVAYIREANARVWPSNFSIFSMHPCDWGPSYACVAPIKPAWMPLVK